jgi:hypothetical protein
VTLSLKDYIFRFFLFKISEVFFASSPFKQPSIYLYCSACEVTLLQAYLLPFSGLKAAIRFILSTKVQRWPSFFPQHPPPFPHPFLPAAGSALSGEKPTKFRDTI